MRKDKENIMKHWFTRKKIDDNLPNQMQNHFAFISKLGENNSRGKSQNNNTDISSKLVLLHLYFTVICLVICFIIGMLLLILESICPIENSVKQLLGV